MAGSMLVRAVPYADSAGMKDMFARSRIALAAVALSLAFGSAGAASREDRQPAYVGSASCAECHGAETRAWTGSQHDLAWTPPNANHILGDFDNARFTHNGVTSVFTREGDAFYIESDGPDGTAQRWPVAGVAGVAPLQQYLIETEPGRLQSFDVVWDVEARRWYHLYPDQDLPPQDAFHWTGPYKTWNARCAECHATGYEKAYAPATRRYESRQAEIGVGCEACHGPGEAHLDWEASREAFDPSAWQPLSPVGLTMDFSDTEAGIQQCASCHSRREPYLDGNPMPGTPYHDAYRLSPLREGLYHPGGQIQDEVYVYGSFLQSKMYEKGVGCMDCHDPHRAEPVAEGNAVCTQCHNPAGNPRFESLPLKVFDAPSHTFHESGTAGAECKSCHMIERIYMGIDGRRDHSFRVPRPDLTVTTGAPNACNDCHDERSPEWAAAAVKRWYPDSTHRGPHYGETFAAARRAPDRMARDVIDIAEHAALPAIVRATALELLAPVATPEIAARLAPLAGDPDPMVRAGAIALQRAAPPTQSVGILLGALTDPSLVVRIAAAREFLNLPVARLPERAQADLDSAMAQWRASLLRKTDFPETQLVIAGIGLTTRDFRGALAAFEEAVTLDPQLGRAWSMIIRIKAALGDTAGARAAANRAVAANPDDASLNRMRAELP